LLLVGIGLAGGIGHYILAVAHRYAPASVLAPFLYQQIIWMMALGYLVFGDVPDNAVVIGAAIVIASGGYLLYRERTAAKR
jgi:drug/metabolite transporter (DMT)-like permease